MPQYKIRIYKSWNVQDDKIAWSNEYEVDSVAATVSDAGLGNLAFALANAEKLIHLSGVYFLRAVISTYHPNEGAYNPSDFRTLKLAGNGARTVAGSDAVDLDLCYWMTRQVSQGFNGKLFYRACMAESDVRTRNNLKPELVPASPLSVDGDAYQAYWTLLEPYTGAQNPDYGLVMLHEQQEPVPALVIRPVMLLEPAGVTRNKADHKYFNRSGTSSSSRASTGQLSEIRLS